MTKQLFMIVALSLACGGGGSTNPSDACRDYCDRLDECDLMLIDFPNCVVNLCKDAVDPREGDDDKCDDAFVDWVECSLDVTCQEFEVEPCPNLLKDVSDECRVFSAAQAGVEDAEERV